MDQEFHEGAYFDGRSARRHAVQLRVLELAGAGGALELQGEGFSRCDPISEVSVSEPLRTAALRIAFRDGAVCEVPGSASLRAALGKSGHRTSLVARMQARPSLVFASILLAMAGLGAAWHWGLPWLADRVARAAPQEIADRIGQAAVENLDRFAFSPSTLDPDRQRTIRARFDALRAPGGERVPHELLFRSSEAFGANAFAFPSGQIVVTDQLVKLAGGDQEILGVLCHELGHVRERHGLRILFASSITGLASAWFLGDVSGILAGAPAALLQASYSREAEAQADDFALRMMRANGIPPSALADVLGRLEHAQDEKTRKAGGNAASRDSADYLASHPATKERIEKLRREP